ncbi:MAG: peptidoglycan DD-metalloendopeptidase family protein [Xanthomonadales bacterium]|nr:peptidoglycan DD-metalloendopeptidase family protein [Xanthomonadaceae bacterium]MBN8223783.1 peptidoglycan DD-metalloendopeptidase family protein [Xanthomonadales bacterium]MCA0196728.1 peptidoglycan DD-metalloendopeptidase family protein [Pseudomonadota bacterium]
MEGYKRMRADGWRGNARIVFLLLAVAALAACRSNVVRTQQPEAGKSASVTGGRSGASVVVQKGDTLYSIARRNNVAVGELARWNNLPEPYTIYPGQRLWLGQSGAGRGTATAPTRTVVAPKSSTGTPAPAPAQKAPVSSGFSWRWPAQGVLLSSYVDGNATRQGIDIGGSSGQPVVAAADGVVVYSGAGLVGYGELIIVKHNEQWLSAYGHNRTRLVVEGQKVKAGQQIAEMGRSGTDREKLHFEIRYNGKPVDPLLYLPKR